MSQEGDNVRDARDKVKSVISKHPAPVSIAIIFGSLARDETHEHSDVDVAVAFDDLEPGEPGYNKALLGLSADLAAALETDDIDLVDIQRASPSLARSVFDEGMLVVGTEEDARELRERLVNDTEDEDRSPAERFDEILTSIDEHLA